MPLPLPLTKGRWGRHRGPSQSALVVARLRSLMAQLGAAAGVGSAINSSSSSSSAAPPFFSAAAGEQAAACGNCGGSSGGGCPDDTADATAELLLKRWMRAGPASGDGNAETEEPEEPPLPLPTLPDLEAALAVSRAMARSPLASGLGGHCGWKLGWKGSFPERQALCGPLFGVGQLRSGDSVSLSAHRVFSAEAECARRLLCLPSMASMRHVSIGMYLRRLFLPRN
eukprot:COSAG01_NODE_5001_length_4553_cov_26.581275_5_plen_227_part_00